MYESKEQRRGRQQWWGGVGMKLPKMAICGYSYDDDVYPRGIYLDHPYIHNNQQQQ